MTKSKKQINKELLEIYKMFPDNKTELVYHTPFQLLIAVMLSAQTTDKQVNKVTSGLFNLVKNPDDLISMGKDRFTDMIKSIGLYKSKSKHIFATAEILSGHGDEYIIPSDVQDLIKLPGVGIKTAKVIAHILYGAKLIAVDTHVHRVANRLSWVHTKTPEQTSKLLEGLIYEDNKSIAHHSIILFGRYHCKAKKPLCDSCPLRGRCDYYKKYCKFD